MQECTSRILMDSCVVYVSPFLNIKKIEFSQTILGEKSSEVCMAMLLVRTQLVSLSCFLSTFFVTEFLLNDLGQFCNLSDAAVFVFSHALRAQDEAATYRSPPVSTHLTSSLCFLLTSLSIRNSELLVGSSLHTRQLKIVRWYFNHISLSCVAV